MSEILWTKFFWNDWKADHTLRACSLEARGFWMELLCIAAKRGGYLALGDVPMTLQAIANNAGVPAKTAERLLAELEANGVLARDAKNRIYARRLVQQKRDNAAARKAGALGGNPTLSKQRRKSRGVKGWVNPSDNPLSQESKARESEVISHKPKASSGSAAATSASPEGGQLARAAAAMGTSVDALRRFPLWLFFEHAFATWVDDGCDAERDIWPIVTRRTVKLGRIPQTPSYFGDAVREARDKRLGVVRPKKGEPQTAPWVSPERYADRLEAYAENGHWPLHWGPKPAGAPPPPAPCELQAAHEGQTEPTARAAP